MVNCWEPGTYYGLGSVVEFQGHDYKIIQAHTSQSDWTPSVTPALWGKLQEHEHHGGNHNNQHGGQQQQQQSYGQQQHEQSYGQQQPVPQPQPDSWKNEPQPGNHTEVTHEEKKKSWWDLDDDRKKQLEIGGGLLAGAAALGAGYFAYKEHEKNDDEKKAQAWALQNWLHEAESRTTAYRQNGLSSPAMWILNEGTNIPSNAIVSGEDSDKGWKMYPCRVFIDGGLQLGKASEVFKKGAVIGYKKEEIHYSSYEILVGDMRGLRWVDCSGRINLNNLNARPVEGGRENDGTPLYIITAHHRGATHPGKTSEKLDGAYIPYDDSEKKVSEYRVLCYA